MKKRCLLFLLIIISPLFSQEESEETVSLKKDSITYLKSTNYTNKKDFKTDLKSKYSGSDFTYKEEKKKERKKEDKLKRPTKLPNFNFFINFLSFMKNVFPFILGGIVIFIILKLYLGADVKFWTFKKSPKRITEKLVYEDEDIDESDIEGLLKKALKAKNNRLAIRYYYLLVLKKMSEKEMIKYDKDKTNSDYLYEIEDPEKRNQFSYISYIYTYVWYGEFNLVEKDFIKVEKKYQSFFKTIN